MTKPLCRRADLEDASNPLENFLSGNENIKPGMGQGFKSTHLKQTNSLSSRTTVAAACWPPISTISRTSNVHIQHTSLQARQTQQVTDPGMAPDLYPQFAIFFPLPRGCGTCPGLCPASTQTSKYSDRSCFHKACPACCVSRVFTSGNGSAFCSLFEHAFGIRGFDEFDISVRW